MSFSLTISRDTFTNAISSMTLILSNGNVLGVNRDDPQFEALDKIREEIIGGVLSLDDAEEKITDLFSEGGIHDVAEKMTALSEKISTDGEAIYYNGERLDGVAEDEIIAIMHRGGNYGPVVKFVERVYDNVSKYVRDQLFGWLKAFSNDDPSNPFHLTEDGKIIGYKGTGIGEDGVTPVSVHFASGPVGYVDVKAPGETEFTRYEGRQIPYPFGCVAKMDRRDCNDNPNEGCSSGLHVGTWGYASAWGKNGYVLTVEVDPVDVVSVPADSGFQKLRACQFQVVGVAKSRMDDVVIGSVGSDLPANDGDDDNEDDDAAICEECGEEYDQGFDGLCGDCSDEFDYCFECSERFHLEDLNDDGLCEDCADSGEDED